MIASKVNFDLLLHLAWARTNIDSSESGIHPKGLPKGFKHQDRHQGFKVSKERLLNSKAKMA